MTCRPLEAAADHVLKGDFRAHYRDVLAHRTLDAWWRERTLGPERLARIAVPTFVVSGNFDLGIGALALWRGLEAHAPAAAERHLLIGPWDHGQCYVGGEREHGPYDFGDALLPDLPALRLAFFDRHLKGTGPGHALPARVTLFVTGANTWQGFDRLEPQGAVSWHLGSAGHANSALGDGTLSLAPPATPQPPDRFVDDPAWPFVAAFAAARGPDHAYDMTEHERDHGHLVYDSGELAEPLTLLGEPRAELWVAADAPDADIVCFLVEHRSDGRSIRLGFGQLRLRYRHGFAQERLLVPGEPVAVRVELTPVVHRVPAGSRLRLLVTGSNFPFADPNPHDGGPIAQATSTRPAVQTLFHDVERPSRLHLPLMETPTP